MRCWRSVPPAWLGLGLGLVGASYGLDSTVVGRGACAAHARRRRTQCGNAYYAWRTVAVTAARRIQHTASTLPARLASATVFGVARAAASSPNRDVVGRAAARADAHEGSRSRPPSVPPRWSSSATCAVAAGRTHEAPGMVKAGILPEQCRSPAARRSERGVRAGDCRNRRGGARKQGHVQGRPRSCRGGVAPKETKFGGIAETTRMDFEER